MAFCPLCYILHVPHVLLVKFKFVSVGFTISWYLCLKSFTLEKCLYLQLDDITGCSAERTQSL